jgi:hypothetical protein
VDVVVEEHGSAVGSESRLIARDRSEHPVLQFNDYALAFHFAAEWKNDHFPEWKGDDEEQAGGGTVREAMGSYERDLLLYAHRDEPPFRTRVVSVPPEVRTLSVRFPANVVYESELWRTRLKGAGDTRRTRTFAVDASATIFERSRIAILNLVLGPLGEESQLNEYDLIKLIKLWEGGEGRPIPGWERKFRFDVDGHRATLGEVLRRSFPDWRPLPPGRNKSAQASRRRVRRVRAEAAQQALGQPYRVGTVELEVPEADWREQLFRDIAALKVGGDAPEKRANGERWDRVVAVGGILQGLLDFRAISPDELADVFAEVEVDPANESICGFHKGTLLSLSAEAEPEPEEDPEEDNERPSPIGVDPYLAIPNVVLLHNEQRLKAARQLELRLSLGQLQRSSSRKARVDINQTADGLDVMTGLLTQHLPNIFHYAAEQRLYEDGSRSRGFEDLETLIRRRREELTSTLQRRERRRDRWTAVLAIVSAVVVGIIAAVQNLVVQEAIEALRWWVALLAAGILYLAFLQVRNRLF